MLVKGAQQNQTWLQGIYRILEPFHIIPGGVSAYAANCRETTEIA